MTSKLDAIINERIAALDERILALPRRIDRYAIKVAVKVRAAFRR